MRHSLRLSIVSRRPRPWLGLIAAPLALQAAVLAGQWWELAIIGPLIYYWTPDRWLWLVGFELGLVGALWGFLGAYALARWPVEVVGPLWIASALLLAVAGHHNRRGDDRDL